jgi:hypothetical protein
MLEQLINNTTGTKKSSAKFTRYTISMEWINAEYRYNWNKGYGLSVCCTKDKPTGKLRIHGSFHLNM